MAATLPQRFQSHAPAAGKFRPEPSTAAKLTDIGTRAIFTEDHDAFRETVRKFIQEHVAPFHDKWEEKGEVPRELWLEAGKLVRLVGKPSVCLKKENA